MMLSRYRCPQCKSRIGLHWLYTCIFSLLGPVFFTLLILFLIDIQLPLLVSVFLFISSFLILLFLVVLIGPLEKKGSKWEP